MLVAILYMAVQYHSTTGAGRSRSSNLHPIDFPARARRTDLLFFAFAFAFAIKVPMFPFHTWLPDATREAPTAGSVILAGVLLKMGAYGFVRFALPFFPQARDAVRAVDRGLAIVGIVYGAMVASRRRT